MPRQRGQDSHAAQSGAAAAASDVHDDGFRLIQGVVTDSDAGASLLPGNARQKGVPCAPRRRFNADAPFASKAWHIRMTEAMRHPPARGQLGHEFQVALARRPADTMIERGDMQADIVAFAPALQQMEQRHRIATAGNGHDHRFSRDKCGVLGERVAYRFQYHVEFANVGPASIITSYRQLVNDVRFSAIFVKAN